MCLFDTILFLVPFFATYADGNNHSLGMKTVPEDIKKLSEDRDEAIKNEAIFEEYINNQDDLDLVDVHDLVPSLNTSIESTTLVLQQIIFQMSLVLHKDISNLIAQTIHIQQNIDSIKQDQNISVLAEIGTSLTDSPSSILHFLQTGNATGIFNTNVPKEYADIIIISTIISLICSFIVSLILICFHSALQSCVDKTKQKAMLKRLKKEISEKVDESTKEEA